MKRFLAMLLVAVAMLVALNALAQKAQMSKEKPKPTTITGELVDMGCYIGRGARGEKHKDCASKCIAGGMPMGLLTAKGELYLLTLNHDNADPYNKCKDMAASMVEVTGTVMRRSGIPAIDVSDVKAHAAAAK